MMLFDDMARVGRGRLAIAAAAAVPGMEERENHPARIGRARRFVNNAMLSGYLECPPSSLTAAL